jgi:V/A-type H+-transporting ATPase subunit E
MDNQNQISQLEKALLDQAESLARERLQNAKTARTNILHEAAERIALAETKERQAARVEADKLIRCRVQAAEGRFTAELDRLRWALTESTLSNVRLALINLTHDPARYQAILEQFVGVAASQFPPGDLVAEVNTADLHLLEPAWTDLIVRAAPGRHIELTGHGRDSLGGIKLRLLDNRARLDQTFEARLERLVEPLAGAIMAKLFAGPLEL